MTAVEQEQVDAAMRQAVAGALRMQATVLRTQADLFGSMARTLEGEAEAIEDGRAPVPSRPVRLVVEPDVTEQQAPERDPALVQAIAYETHGEASTFCMADGKVLTPEMASFLERFDDRLRGSPHFVPVVNEAAEEGYTVSDGTARWVHARMTRYDELGRRGEG